MSNGSISELKIYQLALMLEEDVHSLSGSLTSFFELGNDLRRGSASVAHYVSEFHKRYSYTMKMQSLHEARIEAENTIRLLQEFADSGHGDTTDLRDQYQNLIKQCWGLIKHVKARRDEALQGTGTVSGHNA